MSNVDPNSSRSCLTGCLAVAIAFVLLVSVGIPYLRRLSLDAFEQQQAEWRQEAFNKVKNGEQDVVVSDMRLLQMLADDDDCVRNLQELVISGTSAEISPEPAKNISRLINLRRLGFYDVEGADAVLHHAQGLPIEEIFFEVTFVSEKSLSELSQFPNLRKVHFEQMVQPSEVAILNELPAQIKVEIPYPAESEPASRLSAEQ